MTASPNAPSRFTNNARSTKPRILVTSAAGRTSTPAVLDLLRRGFPVRAMVRRADTRSEALRAAGAEIFVGNQFDQRDLRRALTGVQRAYFCPPYAANLLHGSMLFALAAEEAKLEVVALMSQWNTHATHPVAVTREHWITNNVFRWMPSVDVIHINPGLFAFTYLVGLPVLVHFGMLAVPFGNGRNAPVSNEDIGRVAAGVLADPAPHIGKTYRPTGPELLTPQQVAEALGRVLGRRVKYGNTSTSMFLKAAKTLGIPNFDMDGLRHYARDLSAGAFALGAPTSVVEDITGQPAESFESIARRYLAEPDQIVRGLRAGSRLGAFRFLLKMLLTRTPDLDRWQRSQSHPLIEQPMLATDNPEWQQAAQQGRLLLQPDAIAANESSQAAAPATRPSRRPTERVRAAT